MAPTAKTAPIPHADLEPALRPFGKSHMLPRAAYVDPAVLAWENENFFGGWICVGRSVDLAKAGSQKAVRAASGSVLLIRGEDEVLRGFVNACRHRGHELLPCGALTAKRSVVCPYHAWTYKLDGSMRHAPHMDEVEGYNPDDYGLQSLPVREWHGWVFVAPSGEAEPFEERIGCTRADHRQLRPREPRGRRDARVRHRGQLEGHRGELPGVLPLLDDPPRAVRGQPAGER